MPIAYTTSVDRFARIVTREGARLMGEQAFGLINELDVTTPVVTGQLRNSWIVGDTQTRLRYGPGRGMVRRNRSIIFLWYQRHTRRASAATTPAAISIPRRLIVFNNTPYAYSVEQRRRFFRRSLNSFRPRSFGVRA